MNNVCQKRYWITIRFCQCLLFGVFTFIAATTSAQTPSNPLSPVQTQTLNLACAPFVDIEYFRDGAENKDCKVTIGQKIE